jgi:uncharacterized glyoxalase superfamily protein PhnB
MLVKSAKNPMNLKKITPVLMVDEVEPCVQFWMERLGFEKAAEVPDGEKIGFAILQKGELEIMYQSYASMEKDHGKDNLRELRKGPAFLYVEVEKLDEIIAQIQGAPVVVPDRTTFYGAREIGVKDPGGHIVVFAQFTS